MDPNIMKFFEEDEDETMHSGADVDALTAEFYRYIEGNNSTPQQPSDSSAENPAALSQGNSQTTSQFLPQWHTSGHGGIANFQSGQDPVAMGEKDQLSSELELQRHPINAQVLEHKARLDKELQMNKSQNISHHSSMTVGSNDQQPMLMEFNHQQILPVGKGNQQTSMGISNEQVLPPLNQHTTGMAMTSQQTMTSRISNPQSMTSTTQQPVTTLKLNNQLPFRTLLHIIQPQLDKDRAMQLTTLLSNLKKIEISKDDFNQNLRSIVGDQMIQSAVTKLQIQAARNSQTATNQFQSQPQTSGRQMQVPSDLINSMSDNDAAKLREVEMQEVLHGAQVGQMSTSSSGALCHEWKHPAFPTQGLNKQRNVQFSQTTTSAASSAAIRPPPYESQMRPHSLIDPKKMPAGSLTHMHSNAALQQNEFQCSSSTSKEHKTSISPSMIHVKQKPSVQPNEHKKSQMSSSHGLSSLPTAPNKLGSVATWNMKDESYEIQSSRTGLTQPTTLVPSSSVPSPSPSLMETNILSSSRMPSLTAPLGPANNSKTPPERPLVGQKKSMEAPGSSPPSSKKQKVSGSFVDQSIEHLNDVTAVSGVNISEEEELLFSGSKENSRVSEVFRRVVQEEEERLILQKIPLQKIMVEKMTRCGLKSMSNDMERCLSLCVEERMRGLISNVIRLSKQRVNTEKPRHKTIITSDVRQHIMAINRKACEEWEKKQGETQNLQKLNEPESSTGTDLHKEKDESLGKSTKLNKEDDDKMRTTAANVAIQAATGVGDITSRWHLMIEAKQKQGGFHTSSGPQTNKDVGRMTLTTSTRNRMQNQESEKQDPSLSLTIPASVRKVGRNQVVVPRVARSISVKDVIAVLEREPQLSKSMVLYGLYQKVKGDIVSE